MTGIGAISADGAYTQSGTGANTFSGATTFSSTGTALLISAGRSEVQGTASASYFLTGNTLQVGGFASAAYSRFGTATTGYSTDLDTINDLLISGALEVDANSFLDGKASISGNFQTAGRFIFGDSGDTGEINTSDWDISSTGALTGIGAISADGAYTQTGTGANTFSGATTFSSTGNALLVSAGRAEFQGTASSSYLLTGNTLQVGGYSSAAYSRFGTATTTHAGTISDNDDLLISGGFEVNGSSAFDGFALFSGGASISTNFEITGDNRLGINAGPVTSTNLEIGGTASISGATTLRGVTYTWPSADGSANQRLTTNGSGTLSWATAGGVSSNSLDFDEFVDSMTLDANLTINTPSSRKIGIGAAPSTTFEIQGTASASYLLTGNTLQVGGFASVAYSRFGTSTLTTNPAGNWITTTNDVLVSGDLFGVGSIAFQGPASMSNTLWVSPGGYSGNVGIGTTGPGTKLGVYGTSTANAAWFGTGDGATGLMVYELNTDVNDIVDLLGLNAGISAYNSIHLRALDGFQLFLETTGNVGIGTTGPNALFKVEGNRASQDIAYFFNDGNNANRRGIVIQIGADDASGTNQAVDFQDGDGTNQGYINFTSGTVSYGAFTANHDVSVPDAYNASGYPYGTLLCIKSVYTKPDQPRGIQYDTEACTNSYASNILGAYAGKYEREENLHQVYVLGDGHILVNGEKGDIEVGDLITTSSTIGQGMKAKEFGLTIGIAQENYSFSSPEETKLIAVQYGLRYGPMNAIASSQNALTQDNPAIFDLNILFSSILNQFKKIGVVFENGIVRAKEFIAEKITAKLIKTDSFEIKDDVTGEIYCVKIRNGEWDKKKGECGSTTPQSTPEPSPEPSPSETPAPSPEPTPETTPEPTPETIPESTPPETTPELTPTPEPTPSSSSEPTLE